MKPQRSVLSLGDRVHFDGADHTIVALQGTAVRLQDESGHASVVQLATLMGHADFALRHSTTSPRLEALGLFEQLPADIRTAARRWERHILEVETGRLPDAAADSPPRPGYDPATTTLLDRDAAKAAELTAAGQPTSPRTVQRMRARYAKQGLCGLADQRSSRAKDPLGRADPRVLAAISAALTDETHQSTGTRDRLRRRVRARLDDEHGRDVVELPPRTTFHRLVNVLATGKHTFGSAVTRRQLANRPDTPFTPTTASRPGELTEIDTTPLDVIAVLDEGVPSRVELTMIVDIATRTIGAGIVRPKGTKAVDAALLLGRMLVPEPMRPGWSEALAMSRSVLPHGQLLDVDERLRHAAAKPVIVPETIVCDRGKVYLSEAFMRACGTLGISLQPSQPYTPTNKGVVERSFGSVGTLFCQYVAGYTGRSVDRRGRDVEAEAVWSLVELQELFDEWVVAGWQNRPHDTLRDPFQSARALSPNEMYAAMVAAAGHVPVTVSGDDYIELLPVEWRAINAYGIQLNYRTYDCIDLDPYRRQPSGVSTKGSRWEIHYDPYDLRHIWLRTPDSWITVPWTHLPMVNEPFADFTWRHARELAAARGRDPADETAAAEALDDLLNRAGKPTDSKEPKRTKRIRARTKAAASSPLRPVATPQPIHDEPDHIVNTGQDETTDDNVVLFEIFDAAEEAKHW